MAEATAFAIRIDVAEEVTRLSPHLDETIACLRLAVSLKTVDFLIQELQRPIRRRFKSTSLELTRVGG
jgi:uncharacterized protein YicC (UPF0701 family)